MRMWLAFLMFTLSQVVVPASAWANCTVTASGISFGVYSGGLLSFSGTITTKDDATSCGTQTLSIGLGSSTGYSPRNFSGPKPQLQYTLYQPDHTTIWGSGVNALTWSTGPNTQQNFVVYGTMAASQLAASGSYVDTLLISATTVSGTINSPTMQVSASIGTYCSIAANPLAFGNYSGSLISASTSVTATCSSGTTFNVGLDAGTATGATVASRKMTGPASALLNYTLTTSAGSNWGNTVGTDTVASTGTGNPQAFTVNGKIPASQYATPGSYTDTITATITY